MWECEHCGCKAVAASLDFCPQCFRARTEPEAVKEPETVADGDPSDDTTESAVVPPAQPQKPPAPSPAKDA